MTDDGIDHSRLTDPAELLFRHIHPSWVRDGEPTSQAFKPTAKDAGRLSVSRGSITTAAEAFRHYTEERGFAAAGTWGVTVAEVELDAGGWAGFADPLHAPVADPAHAYVDFTGRSRKEVETKAKLLLAAARTRGQLHP